MSLKITLEGTGPVERKLLKQLQFALVLTYTRAAQVAQAAVQSHLKSSKDFTLRNNFVLNGIRVEPATKAKPEAAVFGRTEGPFSIDFMVRHETGGYKNPTRSQHLSIPVGVRRNKKEIVTRANRPRALLGKDKIFKIDEKTPKRFAHNLAPGIYQRVGRRTKKGGGKLKLLFALEQNGRIKPRFDFVKTALTAAGAALPRAFAEALRQVLSTAR